MQDHANNSQLIESSGLSDILGPDLTKLFTLNKVDLPSFDIDHTVVIICRKNVYEKIEEDSYIYEFEGTKANWWRGAVFMRKSSTPVE
jgi:hypothetical protein